MLTLTSGSHASPFPDPSAMVPKARLAEPGAGLKAGLGIPRRTEPFMHKVGRGTRGVPGGMGPGRHDGRSRARGTCLGTAGIAAPQNESCYVAGLPPLAPRLLSFMPEGNPPHPLHPACCRRWSAPWPCPSGGARST